MTSTVQKRNSGIELLRILTMGMIVFHHLLLHGGLLFSFPDFSLTGMGMQLLNSFTRLAVNAYALITGYVMVHSRFRPSRLIGLWLQVVFFGLFSVGCLALLGQTVSFSDVFSAFTPISHDLYWYFTCYAVVFCLSPFLNNLILNQSKNRNMMMILALLFFFSVLPAIAAKDIFQLNGGYHAVWLMILYLCGAAIRVFDLHIKRKNALFILIVSIVLAWAFRLLMLRLEITRYADVLLSYSSPTMCIGSLALFLAALDVHVPKRIEKAVTLLSPLTFGVYLIHDNPLIRKQFIEMRTAPFAQLNAVSMLANLLLCWAGVYGACLLLEWLRTKIFSVLRLPEMCLKAEQRLFCAAERFFKGQRA